MGRIRVSFNKRNHTLGALHDSTMAVASRHTNYSLEAV